MKRRELIRHLIANGCRLMREGANHSWWENPALNRRSAVPRHTEINRFPARKSAGIWELSNRDGKLKRGRSGEHNPATFPAVLVDLSGALLKKSGE